MLEAALEGSDDLRRNQSDADTVRMDGWEDLGAKLVLDRLKLLLAELALHGWREEDEVSPFRVGDGLEIAVVYGDGGGGAGDDDNGDDCRVAVPFAGAVAAAAGEALEPLLVAALGVEGASEGFRGGIVIMGMMRGFGFEERGKKGSRSSKEIH